MAKAEITINIENMPETIAAMRLEVCRALRRVALSEEDGRVCERLLEVADAFECGQASESDLDGARE